MTFLSEFDKLYHLRERLPAVAAIVVEEFGDRDIAVADAERGQLGLHARKVAVELGHARTGGFAALRLGLLLISIPHFQKQLGMVDQIVFNDLLNRLHLPVAEAIRLSDGRSAAVLQG